MENDELPDDGATPDYSYEDQFLVDEGVDPDTGDGLVNGDTMTDGDPYSALDYTGEGISMNGRELMKAEAP